MGMEAFDLSVRAGTVRITYRTYVGNLSGRYYPAEIVYVYKRQSVGGCRRVDDMIYCFNKPRWVGRREVIS